MKSLVEIDAVALIDIRDELAVVRDLVISLCLACSSPILPRDERAALTQLSMLVRERLVQVTVSLDGLAPSGEVRWWELFAGLRLTQKFGDIDGEGCSQPVEQVDTRVEVLVLDAADRRPIDFGVDPDFRSQYALVATQIANFEEVAG